jgi:hypothetical protein
MDNILSHETFLDKRNALDFGMYHITLKYLHFTFYEASIKIVVISKVSSVKNSISY